MSKWWQGIITLCVGLAAVGVVVWFFASSFFITKDKFNDDRSVRDNVQSGTSEQLIQIGKTLAELNKTTAEISAQIHIIQIDLAVIKAQPRRAR